MLGLLCYFGYLINRFRYKSSTFIQAVLNRRKHRFNEPSFFYLFFFQKRCAKLGITSTQGIYYHLISHTHTASPEQPSVGHTNISYVRGSNPRHASCSSPSLNHYTNRVLFWVVSTIVLERNFLALYYVLVYIMLTVTIVIQNNNIFICFVSIFF